jgi:hypothetical protein
MFLGNRCPRRGRSTYTKKNTKKNTRKKYKFFKFRISFFETYRGFGFKVGADFPTKMKKGKKRFFKKFRISVSK